MSPRVPGKPNAKNAPAAEHDKQEPPISGVSPNDPIDVKPSDPGTGRPGQRQR